MEKFFAQGTLEPQDILPGLKREIVERKIFPVLCTSSSSGIGTLRILDACVALLPSPEGRKVEGTGKDGKPVMVFCNEKDHAVAQVIKTVSDPFAGRISYLRVFAGHFQSDGNYWNSTKGVHERFSGLFLPQGKEHVNVPEAQGRRHRRRGEAEGDADGRHADDEGQPRRAARSSPCPRPRSPTPSSPRRRATRTRSRPPSTSSSRRTPRSTSSATRRPRSSTSPGPRSSTSRSRSRGSKKRYGVEVILHPPKVPYRETITRKAEAHGRHKKQTGGHGQFADCRIRVEPLPRGKDFEFVDDIYGGAIPRNFIPAVEKGIQEVRRKGFLAGYPMVDFRVTLYDGQYHDVDSSELAFKLAGALAYKEAMAAAKPTLLEPVMNVEITAPNEYVGDLMGDLSSRRGKVEGMDAADDDTVIKAQVPMSELLTYGAQLRSITQGRGTFHLEFSHYAEVPHALQEKVIAQSKGKGGEAKEA